MTRSQSVGVDSVMHLNVSLWRATYGKGTCTLPCGNASVGMLPIPPTRKLQLASHLQILTQAGLVHYPSPCLSTKEILYNAIAVC